MVIMFDMYGVLGQGSHLLWVINDNQLIMTETFTMLSKL